MVFAGAAGIGAWTTSGVEAALAKRLARSATSFGFFMIEILWQAR
jgi:hypothetical protein